MTASQTASGDQSLDAADLDALRALGHRMIDDAVDELASLRETGAWRPMPDAVRAAWSGPLPRVPENAASVYDEYRRLIAPYATGNRHPGFMGWVHGGGTFVGALAEFLAGALNANLGGRDHAPVACERQVIAWAAEMLGFPPDASGLLVTGTSIANLIAVLVARTDAIGADSRARGLRDVPLVAYASVAAHGCVPRALDMAGIGSDALRMVPCDAQGALRLDALQAMIADDLQAGLAPFLVVGTAGSVDSGAIDHLDELATLCARHDLWFHVDAAYGAIAMLSHRYRPRLAGIERADSVAFDFHKWAQVPYDAGCIVVRDARAHRAAFARPATYLSRTARGLAAGDPWPCDFGPDLSRGFRALKVWMTLKTYGGNRLGQVVDRCCDVARHLAARIDAEPLLLLAAPVGLNIVCFRFTPGDDAMQAAIAEDVQLSGIAAPSTTVIDGRVVIRAAIVNHRTTERDVDALVDATLLFAQRRTEAARA